MFRLGLQELVFTQPGPKAVIVQDEVYRKTPSGRDLAECAVTLVPTQR